MREHYQTALLLLLTLAVFLPGLQAGYFIFDDLGIIESLQAKGTESLSLIPAEGSRYLRPLLLLTFLIDVHLWNASPGIMRLENLLLHAGNAMLVFSIVKNLLPAYPDKGRWIPLLAGSLFVLHPTTSESINWIAGRSDPLAALFVLLGFRLLLAAFESKRRAWIIWSAGVIFLGCLVKEVAVFALLGFIAILLFCRNRQASQELPWSWRLQACLPYLLALLIYTLLRTRFFSVLDQAAANILTGSKASSESMTETFFQAFTALGFYFKKLLFPFPLNFAIDQVSPYYFWMSLAGLGLSFLILRGRDFRAGAALLMIMTILPAVLNAMFHVAWTPYAERYLYLPAAFFVITLLANIPSTLLNIRFPYGLAGLLLLFFLPLTVHRNLLWQDPFLILEDARHQNPDNLTLHNNYAIVLTDRAGPEAGRKEFLRILAIHPDHQQARSNLAKIALYLQDDPERARQDLDVYFNGKQKPTPNILALMKEVREKSAASPAEGE